MVIMNRSLRCLKFLSLLRLLRPMLKRASSTKLPVSPEIPMGIEMLVFSQRSLMSTLSLLAFTMKPNCTPVFRASPVTGCLTGCLAPCVVAPCVVWHRQAIDTFIDTLRKIGFERIPAVGIKHGGGYNLVSKDKRPPMPGRIWQHECDGWYIYSNISNGTKEEDLKRISDHYHLSLSIEEGRP